MAVPKKDPVLHSFLISKMLELRLMMIGISRAELSTMTAKEIQVVIHLLSHMSRDENEQ